MNAGVDLVENSIGISALRGSVAFRRQKRAIRFFRALDRIGHDHYHGTLLWAPTGERMKRAEVSMALKPLSLIWPDVLNPLAPFEEDGQLAMETIPSVAVLRALIMFREDPDAEI